MTDSTPTLELYNLQGCPYCVKVRRALDDLGLSYETHDVPRSRSDRNAVHAASGQRGVPVLVDRSNGGIEGMAESEDIVAYLYEAYGDGERPPSGIVDRVLSVLF